MQNFDNGMVWDGLCIRPFIGITIRPTDRPGWLCAELMLNGGKQFERHHVPSEKIEGWIAKNKINNCGFSWSSHPYRPQPSRSQPVSSTSNLPSPSIYFIRAKTRGPIKIGISVFPEKRLGQIQVFCPYPLKIIATIPNSSRETEREIHRRFLSSSLSGEWFSPSPELLDFIKMEAIAWKRKRN